MVLSLDPKPNIGFAGLKNSWKGPHHITSSIAVCVLHEATRYKLQSNFQMAATHAWLGGAWKFLVWKNHWKWLGCVQNLGELQF